MKLKLSIGVAGFAFIVSALIGFIIDNTIINLLWKAAVFAVLFFGLSFGSWHFLEKRVPELFEALSQVQFRSKGDDSGLDENGVSTDQDQDTGDALAGQSLEDTDSISGKEDAADQVAGMASSGSSKVQNLGDHILIRDKKIKNEPKIIAEALRTMMDKEDD